MASFFPRLLIHGSRNAAVCVSRQTRSLHKWRQTINGWSTLDRWTNAHNYRLASKVVRQRLKWIALGSTVAGIATGVFVLNYPDDDYDFASVEPVISRAECAGATPSGARNKIQLFQGNAHPALGKAIADELGIEVSGATVEKFKCGETKVVLHESVRDNDVFIINPTCNPNPNDYLMEVLIMVDACKRGGAGRITAVLPIFGYARQDKKHKPRAPISAKLVADMLETAGVDRIICVDLHAAQIQGFVSFPMDNLYSSPLILDHIKTNFIKDGRKDDVVICSPDAGGAKRAEKMARKLETGLAIFSKTRVRDGEVSEMILVGDVKGKKVVLVDDMCDTGGTLCKAAAQLVEAGATEVHAAVTHGVLSEPALDRIQASAISQFIVTDTIPMEKNLEKCKNLVVLPVGPLLARAISHVHTGESISMLFEEIPKQLSDIPKPWRTLW
eukprot:m.187116 g.187116  ORF g.187116 m.187116 type:complete len:444 (+) comp32293_c1_seq13:167-1498(+)